MFAEELQRFYLDRRQQTGLFSYIGIVFHNFIAAFTSGQIIIICCIISLEMKINLRIT